MPSAVCYAIWRRTSIPLLCHLTTRTEALAIGTGTFALVYCGLILHAPQVAYLLVLLIAILYIAERNKRRRQYLNRLEDYAELKDETFIGIVEVIFKFRGMTYGSDIGALNIDERFIHFHGHRTEFSVSSHDVRRLEVSHEVILLNRFSFQFDSVNESSSRSSIDRETWRLAKIWKQLTDSRGPRPPAKLNLALSQVVTQRHSEPAESVFPPIEPMAKWIAYAGPLFEWGKFVVNSWPLYYGCVVVLHYPWKLQAIVLYMVVGAIYWITVGIDYHRTTRRLLRAARPILYDV